MRFVAIIDVQPSTTIISVDSVNVIDTGGNPLNQSNWRDFVISLPMKQERTKELDDFWKREMCPAITKGEQ